jgi:hypothetical protein
MKLTPGKDIHIDQTSGAAVISASPKAPQKPIWFIGTVSAQSPLAVDGKPCRPAADYLVFREGEKVLVIHDGKSYIATSIHRPVAGVISTADHPKYLVNDDSIEAYSLSGFVYVVDDPVTLLPIAYDQKMHYMLLDHKGIASKVLDFESDTEEDLRSWNIESIPEGHDSAKFHMVTDLIYDSSEDKINLYGRKIDVSSAGVVLKATEESLIAEVIGGVSSPTVLDNKDINVYKSYDSTANKAASVRIATRAKLEDGYVYLYLRTFVFDNFGLLDSVSAEVEEQVQGDAFFEQYYLRKSNRVTVKRAGAGGYSVNNWLWLYFRSGGAGSAEAKTSYSCGNALNSLYDNAAICKKTVTSRGKAWVEYRFGAAPFDLDIETYLYEYSYSSGTEVSIERRTFVNGTITEDWTEIASEVIWASPGVSVYSATLGTFYALTATIIGFYTGQKTVPGGDSWVEEPLLMSGVVLL